MQQQFTTQPAEQAVAARPQPRRDNATRLVDRRSVLLASGAVAGAALVAGASPGTTGRAAALTAGEAALASGEGGVAVSVHETRVVTQTATEILTPPFPTDYVGLVGDEIAVAPSSTLVVTGNGGTGRSLEALPDCAEDDDGRGRPATALLRVAEPRRVEAPDATSGRLVALGLTVGALQRLEAPPRTATRWTSEALDHVLASIGRRSYLSRGRWGADESLRFDENGEDRWGYAPRYYPAQTLTVHHTAGVNDDPDPGATVRAIYRFHTIERGFGDIGYQLLIDEQGRLYEGRYSGEDILPGHDTNLLAVQGAHVGGINSGNFGVALLGNFMTEKPTAAAIGTLAAVLAGLAVVHDLDPEADTTYQSPVLSHVSIDIATVPGHRDWRATLCPGDLLYGQLSWLRLQAARLIDRPGPGTLWRIMAEAVAEGRARPNQRPTRRILPDRE